MRVIAGHLRHRELKMTNLETTRETQDKVRGAIFNMIGPYFDGGIALDLFAGSGAMAIEAYSRGINSIYLNDLNNNALNVCKANCKSLGIEDAFFSNLDYQVFLDSTDVIFDLIILDPPYKMNNIKQIITPMLKRLSSDGLLVFEMSIDTKYDLEYENLVLIKDKTYGIKRVCVYKNKK